MGEKLKLKDALSKISGIPVDSINQLWEGVKTNKALLDSCNFHEFDKEINCNVGSSKWQCVSCQGIVSGDHKRWYELGVEHRSKRDIW